MRGAPEASGATGGRCCNPMRSRAHASPNPLAHKLGRALQTDWGTWMRQARGVAGGSAGCAREQALNTARRC